MCRRSVLHSAIFTIAPTITLLCSALCALLSCSRVTCSFATSSECACQFFRDALGEAAAPRPSCVCDEVGMRVRLRWVDAAVRFRQDVSLSVLAAGGRPLDLLPELRVRAWDSEARLWFLSMRMPALAPWSGCLRGVVLPGRQP